MVKAEQDDARARADEVARYRRAAEETLHQLDWCVSYLHRIRKDHIAQVIEQNRSFIRQEMNRAGK